MAGYYGYSKSNNAVNAEANGMMTATRLARALKCSSRAVKELLTPAEWHHTSGYYNHTNYYDEPQLLAAADVPGWGGAESLDAHERAFAEAALRDLREWRGDDTLTLANVLVRWIEWSGSRNHLYATKRESRAITAVRKGCMWTMTFERHPKYNIAPFVLRKREGANGFSVEGQ